jgi:hypothetical protein
MTSLKCVGWFLIKKLVFLNNDARCDNAEANTILSAPIPSKEVRNKKSRVHMYHMSSDRIKEKWWHKERSDYQQKKIFN